LSDGDKVGFVDSVGERKEGVNAAAQNFRLVSGFTMESDEPDLTEPLTAHSFSTIPT
jgi:hypothetical protein